MFNVPSPKLLALLLALPVAAAQGTMTGGDVSAPPVPGVIAPSPAGGVTVTATGTAYGEPDQASFDAGVTATERDVQTALDEVNERVGDLMNALEDAGVAAEDIRTSNFAVYPDQAYRPDGTPGELRYRVTNTVSVRVRDTSELGELLGASVEAGANEIWNVVFSLSNRDELEREAREEAMRQAQERAQQLAALSGAGLGAVMRVVEGQAPVEPFPSGRAEVGVYAMSESGSAPVPVSSGQLAVTVTVQVTFAIVE